jgi:hypothetical protein
MSDPNHFFHDMIEGVVIWEDGAKEPSSPPIDVPAEASSVMDVHVVEHHHDDALQDAPEHPASVVEAHASHPDDTGAAAEHASDAHATEVASADVTHDGDAATG